MKGEGRGVHNIRKNGQINFSQNHSTRVNSSKVLQLKTVGITLPVELVKKARKYGLNISFIARKALIQEINRIENSKGGIGTVGSDLAGPAGFEPATPGLKARCSNPC